MLFLINFANSNRCWLAFIDMDAAVEGQRQLNMARLLFITVGKLESQQKNVCIKVRIIFQQARK